jgi:prepilin-type N-terminal cleavage/methylation domain-containing protein
MRTHRIKVKRIDGFTLIELLTVVAIIGLLVGMVVPTIKAVLEQKQQMLLKVRINSLSTGCDIYKMSATGNRYYPGQDAEGLAALISGTNTSGNYPNCLNAGSALLARCLFTMIDPNDSTKKLFPVSNYGSLEKDMLDAAQDPVTGVPRSIIDYASETMAILYYPSRLAEKGKVTQYPITPADDNSKYVTAANSAKNTGGVRITIQSHVLGTTTGTTTIVRQDGLFVITAAGTDRLYFSTSAVSNF